jgi:integrase/recombinase XerC
MGGGVPGVKPHPLTRAQARALLDEIGRRRDGPRNRALFAAMYRGGLRVLEACRQELVDWDPANKGGASVLRVSHPKGEASWGWHRSVGLDPIATAMIVEWVEQRGLASGPLFITAAGESVHPSHVRRLLRRVAADLEVGRRVHPHCLRHTFARELYDEGKGIREIQLALGHSSLDTTQKYLQSIGATEAVAATMEREAW